MDYFTNIGNNIITEIKQQNLKQTKVAEAIGVSRQVFQKIVKGQKAINVFELSKIATALSTSVEELIKEAADKQGLETEFQFMGEFVNNEDLRTLDMIINQYLDMREDIDELKKHANS